MTHEKVQTVFKNYLDAFAKTSPAEQEELLRASVAEDVVFTNPGVEGQGRDRLLAHIAIFQKKFPGNSFRMNWLREQHGQLLSEWTQINQDGSEFITAHSYARLDEQGRLAHLAGFWSPGDLPAR